MSPTQLKVARVLHCSYRHIAYAAHPKDLVNRGLFDSVYRAARVLETLVPYGLVRRPEGYFATSNRFHTLMDRDDAQFLSRPE